MGLKEVLLEEKKDKKKNDKKKNGKNEKKNGKKMLNQLHALDDQIEEFIDGLENKIMEVDDNPVFVKKAQQLLADMSKEYSEFIMALRAVVNSVDRKGQMLPSRDDRFEGKVRDVNANVGNEEEAPPPEEAPPEEEEGGDEEFVIAKKDKKSKSAVKEALERD